MTSRIIRLAFYLSAVVILFIAVQIRKNVIKQDTKKEIISQVSIWEKNGRPVDIIEIKKNDLNFHIKLSAKVASECLLVSYVTYQEWRLIRSGYKFNTTLDGQNVDGKISRVASDSDLDSGLYSVALKLNQDVPCLVDKSLIVPVLVHTKKFKNLVTVPKESFFLEQGKYYVWKSIAGKAQKQEIKIGKENMKSVEVTSGVSEGDLIIVRGQTKLKEGDTLFVHEKLVTVN